MSAEHVLAALGAVVCLVLLFWPLAPARFQQLGHRRWSAFAHSVARGWHSVTSKTAERARTKPQPPRKPEFKDATPDARAEREAQTAIDKARRRADSVDRQGNVYRPRRFGARKDAHGDDDAKLH